MHPAATHLMVPEDFSIPTPPHRCHAHNSPGLYINDILHQSMIDECGLRTLIKRGHSTLPLQYAHQPWCTKAVVFGGLLCIGLEIVSTELAGNEDHGAGGQRWYPTSDANRLAAHDVIDTGDVNKNNGQRQRQGQRVIGHGVGPIMFEDRDMGRFDIEQVKELRHDEREVPRSTGLLRNLFLLVGAVAAAVATKDFFIVCKCVLRKSNVVEREAVSIIHPDV